MSQCLNISKNKGTCREQPVVKENCYIFGKGNYRHDYGQRMIILTKLIRASLLNVAKYNNHWLINRPTTISDECQNGRGYDICKSDNYKMSNIFALY